MSWLVPRDGFFEIHHDDDGWWTVLRCDENFKGALGPFRAKSTAEDFIRWLVTNGAGEGIGVVLSVEEGLPEPNYADNLERLSDIELDELLHQDRRPESRRSRRPDLRDVLLDFEEEFGPGQPPEAV
jgi:hypothetical protein